MANPTPNNSGTDYSGYLQSRTYSFADYDGPKTFTETWVLQRKDVGAVSWQTFMPHLEVALTGMISQLMIPELGTKYSTWIDAYVHNPAMTISPASGYYWQNAYCTSVEIQTTKTSQLIATFTFTARICDGNAGANLSFYPVNVECVSGTRPMETFRRDPVTGPSATLDISAADIGGSAWMVGGVQGAQTDVPFVRYRLKRVWDVTVTGHKVSTVAAVYGSRCGHRNSASFMGLGVGTCVLESISITRLEGPLYEIAFDIIADSFYEHSQSPTYDVDGTPKTDGVNLLDVKWKRPTRTSYDFNKIFFGATLDTADANIQASAERGYLEP